MTPDFTYSPYERMRINLLRALFLLTVPAVLLIHPSFAETLIGETFEVAGILLIIAGILGRAWSILYIGGHKNTEIVTDGPYSLCRHPLYLFSTIAVFGFGIEVQSLTFAIVLTTIFGTALFFTAMREEVRLRRNFGPAYEAYAKTTPAILPKLSNFRTERLVTFDTKQLRRNFWDATVFLFLIPLAEFIEFAREVSFLPGGITLP